MVKLSLNQQTQYSLINKMLSQLDNAISVQITYGRAFLQTKLAKAKHVSEENIDPNTFYICIKADNNILAKDAIYEARKTLNSIIGWGSDQIHISENDIDLVINSNNINYYFIELEGK